MIDERDEGDKPFCGVKPHQLIKHRVELNICRTQCQGPMQLRIWRLVDME